MSLHPRLMPVAVEIPGLAYFSALPDLPKQGVPAAKVPQPVDILNEMYAYYSEA